VDMEYLLIESRRFGFSYVYRLGSGEIGTGKDPVGEGVVGVAGGGHEG